MKVRDRDAHTRRPPAIWLLVLTVCAAGLLVPVAADAQTPSTAPGGAPSDGAGEEGGGGLLTLAGCIQGSRHLAVTFVFDESRSLKETDPEALRVDAALNALDGLVEMTTGPEDVRTQVDLEIAAFSDRYRVALPWTTLDSETAPTIRASMTRFRKRVNGIETDIVNALIGARSALSAQAADVEANLERTPCKALVLFTDGDYVVNVRTSKTAVTAGTTKSYAPGADLTSPAGAKAAMAAGREAACKPDGIADGLRRDDVVLLSVILRPESEGPGDGFLQAITTGRGPDGACGRISANGSGEVMKASDTDALVVGFDGITSRAAGGTPVPPPDDAKVCEEERCDAGSQEFQVDALTRRFRVLALGSAGGVAVRLSGPGGETVVADAGAVELGDLDATANDVAGRGFAVTVDRPADGDDWTGTWTVTVEGSGKSAGKAATVQVYLFSDISVRLLPGGFERGAATEVSAELVVPKGTASKGLVRSATARALVEDPISGSRSTVVLKGPAEGPFVGTFTAPAATTANAFTVSAELTVVTVDGARTTTRSPRSPVLVRRPKGSVQFAPAVLEMPAITGKGSTSADLVVVGGDADSCIWVDEATFDGAGGLSVTINGQEPVGEASCIEVAKGESSTLTVELNASERADATVHGVVRLSAKSGSARPVVTDFQVTTSLVRGIDQARRLLLAVLLMAGGLLLPLGLLVLINTASARFQSLDVVRGAAIPVRVAGGTVERIDDGIRRLRFSDSDFESLADAGNTRRFTFGGVEFRAKASRNPFGATVALAAPEGGAEKLKGGVGRKVELDTMLAGSWLFMLDPDATRSDRRGVAEGTLLAFITEGPSGEQFNRLVTDVNSRLGGVAARLERAVRAQAPEQST